MPPEPEPHFLLEAIEVVADGPRQAEIIKGETLLRAGETYSESAIRQAVYRVRRLPFVTHAEPQLRKGSRRGTYELVIEVDQAEDYFFQVQAWQVYFRRPINLGSTRPEESESSLALRAGRRFFVGGNGVFHAALEGGSSAGEGGVEVGYSHYDLFDRKIVAGAGFAYLNCCPARVLPLGLSPELVRWETEDSRRAYFFVSVPLSAGQAIQGTLSLLEGEPTAFREVVTEDPGSAQPGVFDLGSGSFRLRQADLKWIYNSTDDPVLPREGVRLAAGVELTQVRAPEVVGSPRQRAQEAQMAALTLGGAQHWPVGRRQSVAVSWRGALGHSELDRLTSTLADGQSRIESYDVLEAAVGLGYSIDLWKPAQARRFGGDLRLEVRGDYGLESISLGSDLLDDPMRRAALTASLSLRNAWGVFRFHVSLFELYEIG